MRKVANRQTNNDENVSSLAEVTKFVGLSRENAGVQTGIYLEGKWVLVYREKRLLLPGLGELLL